MSETKIRLPRIFDSARVTAIVGIHPIYLNKLVERKKYGLGPHFQIGEGRGSRRLFTDTDVFGVALVWWLFESGLRSDTIQYVLNQICGRKLNSTANEAAGILIKEKAQRLAVMRKPRCGLETYENRPKQRVELVDKKGAAKLARERRDMTTLVVPIDELLRELESRMGSRI